MIAIIFPERGMPSRDGSSGRPDYVPGICTHRPSLCSIGCCIEFFQGYGVKLAFLCPSRGWPKLCNMQQLESIKVVTRLPKGNLRQDHSLPISARPHSPHTSCSAQNVGTCSSFGLPPFAVVGCLEERELVFGVRSGRRGVVLAVENRSVRLITKQKQACPVLTACLKSIVFTTFPPKIENTTTLFERRSTQQVIPWSVLR